MNVCSSPSRNRVRVLVQVFLVCLSLFPGSGAQIIPRLGSVTVEPSALFLLGSNLTVTCRLRTCERRSRIFLELDGQLVKDRTEVNCSTVKFHLLHVSSPGSSWVICKLRSDRGTRIVSGQDLHGGRPPDKPQNIHCQTSRSSDFISCSWKSGAPTFLNTTINISVSSENKTQIHWAQIQDSEEIRIPRGVLEENTKHQLILTSYNHLGLSRSDPFTLCVRDAVTPDLPQITQLDFEQRPTVAALLLWNSTNASHNLTTRVRLRRHKGFWEVREELSGGGVVRVDDLRPLTQYEFQLSVCDCRSGLNHSSALCSSWSDTATAQSPGKGPSEGLRVWRRFNSNRTVTVLWKPPLVQDYSGKVLRYQILLGKEDRQEVTHPDTSCSLQVPADIGAVSVSVVTSYGSSPPADVPLTRSGEGGAVLTRVSPEDDGAALSASWWRRAPPTDLLFYVVETSSDGDEGWIHTHTQHTTITGLRPGVRYRVSVSTVTSRGVSAPSSALVYSKQLKPASGPSLAVLRHEDRRMLIVWEELPVAERRGFITNYTLYVQTLDPRRPQLTVWLPGSGLRRKWLDCPEGALVLQMTASTSAGEGPRGNAISSQPMESAVVLVVQVVVIISLLVAMLTNVMCWSCVRKRIKQKCLSWGPAWFHENLPKPGNSNAIRLLQQDSREPCLVSRDSDPKLSPISLLSWGDREDVYPFIHMESTKLGRNTSVTDTRTVQHVGYKPHIGVSALRAETLAETGQETGRGGQEDTGPSVFLGGLLSSVELDCPAGGPLLSEPTRPAQGSSGGVLEAKDRAESRDEVVSSSVELQHSNALTSDPAETCLSPAETALTNGYFPQVAAVRTGSEVTGPTGESRESISERELCTDQ